MAVAFESVSTPVWEGNASGETLVMTKPTGLAAGDLIVAHLSQVYDGDSSWNTLSGWTALFTERLTTAGGNDVRMSVFYKTADAGDAAASDFTFTKSGSDGAWCAGAIYRISGAGSIPAHAVYAVEGDTTPAYVNTITPAFADSILLFLVTAGDFQASGSVTGYAVTTDNPTWTERYDVYGDSGGFFAEADGLMSGATAPRSQVSATGDSSVTLTNFTHSIGAILVIAPVVNVSASPAVITGTFSVQAPTVAANANVTVSATLTATFTTQAPTVTFPTPEVSNLDKSATSTFTNPDKS